jgi:hypothetical protein
MCEEAKAIGRPRLETEVIHIHIHLRLRKGEDDDVIQFFQRAGERRKAMRLKQALRTGNMQLGIAEAVTDDAALADSVDDFLFSSEGNPNP